jgi:hypothetical protein
MTRPSHRDHKNTVLAASVTIAFVAGALASTTAHAEDTAWCPKAGTVVKGSDSKGAAWSWTALGPDPGDATVCRTVDGAHEGSFADGDHVQRRLFNPSFRLSDTSIY